MRTTAWMAGIAASLLFAAPMALADEESTDDASQVLAEEATPPVDAAPPAEAADAANATDEASAEGE